MSPSNSGSDLESELTSFDPSVGASTHRIGGQHSSPLGQGGVGRREEASPWNYGLSLFHRVVFQQRCKVKNFINITLLRLLGHPKSQILWVMGQALSTQ